MHAKEYSVSIIIKTEKAITCSEELNKRLGLKEEIFYEKTFAKKSKTKDFNYWILDSSLAEHDPLEDHLNSFVSSFPANFKMNPDTLVNDVYLDVGVFYDMVNFSYCSLSCDIKTLKRLESIFPGLTLEVSVYPCEDNDG